MLAIKLCCTTFAYWLDSRIVSSLLRSAARLRILVSAPAGVTSGLLLVKLGGTLGGRGRRRKRDHQSNEITRQAGRRLQMAVSKPEH